MQKVGMNTVRFKLSYGGSGGGVNCLLQVLPCVKVLSIRVRVKPDRNGLPVRNIRKIIVQNVSRK